MHSCATKRLCRLSHAGNVLHRPGQVRTLAKQCRSNANALLMVRLTSDYGCRVRRSSMHGA